MMPRLSSAAAQFGQVLLLCDRVTLGGMAMRRHEQQTVLFLTGFFLLSIAVLLSEIL